MLTFLINLDAAHHRRTVMRARLAAAHVRVTRVGVDLRDCDGQGVARWCRAHFPQLSFDLRRMSCAEAGCWASHLTAWQLLRDSTAPACTVIEDDLILEPGFAAAAQALAMQDAFDFIYLGTSSKNISTRRRTRIGDLWVHAPLGVIFNTWAYVMTRGYAERFLAATGLRIDMPIDHFLGGRARSHKARVAVLRPAVVTEDPAIGPQSQIQPYTTRLDRHPLWEGARRAVLASRISKLYYALYRWL